MGTASRRQGGNPWSQIPLDEYEAHMAMPSVGQAALLAEVLAEAVLDVAARSVAVLGCAGGNGFERLLGTGVERVVGIDINAGYVERARERFSSSLPGLECLVGDIEHDDFAFAPVDLVFAGLIFEYVDLHRALANARTVRRASGGKAFVVLAMKHSSAMEAL